MNCATVATDRKRYRGSKVRVSGGNIVGLVGRRFFEKLRIYFGSVDGSLGSASIAGSVLGFRRGHYHHYQDYVLNVSKSATALSLKLNPVHSDCRGLHSLLKRSVL